MYYVGDFLYSLCYWVGTTFPRLQDHEVYAVVMAMLVLPLYLLCVLVYRPRREVKRLRAALVVSDANPEFVPPGYDDEDAGFQETDQVLSSEYMTKCETCYPMLCRPAGHPKFV